MDDALKNSLKKQIDTKYEFIEINAQEYGFLSASETLNYAGNLANGEYIIFVHQDVIFENIYTLSTIENICKNTYFGIAGVAGIIENSYGMITASKIHHGEKHEIAAKYTEFYEPIPAYGLDECMLIVPSNIFKKYKFRNIGATWHLYGTDYSLQMHACNIPVFIFPIDIWHLSSGASLNINYFDALWNLTNICNKDQKVIYTIFGKWPINRLKLFIKCFYRKIRFVIKR